MGDTKVAEGRRAVAHDHAVASKARACAECGRWEPTEAVSVLIAPAIASAEMLAEHHAFCSVRCLMAWSTRLRVVAD